MNDETKTRKTREIRPIHVLVTNGESFTHTGFTSKKDFLNFLEEKCDKIDEIKNGHGVLVDGSEFVAFRGEFVTPKIKNTISI